MTGSSTPPGTRKERKSSGRANFRRYVTTGASVTHSIIQKAKKMKNVEVKVMNKGNQQLPSYATVLSAGADLRANISEPIVLQPMERKLIGTGLSIALPECFEAQVRPRSGLALKHGITVLNTPGTIDAKLPN